MSSETARKKPGGDSTDFLANLDLSKAVDSSASMCPKCGAEIPEGAEECPKCGIDPSTGKLSTSAKKRLSRRGPDPTLYYAAAWKDSWAFTMANKSLAVRTALYGIGTWMVMVGCAFMVFWCTQLPPKVFWAAFLAVAALIMPGWQWYLNVEIVRATMSKKDDVTDLNFDVFQNISLGIKSIVWMIVYGLWFPPLWLMYPLAMVHFTTPVKTKAWVSPLMVPVFLRSLAPTLYFWVVGFSVFLLAWGGTAVLGLVYGASMRQLVDGSWTPPAVLRWTLLGVSIAVSIFSVSIFSFGMIFVMRVNGLLGYYFKERLDLTTIVAEKTYVRRLKEVKRDAFGNPIKTPGQKAAKIIVPIVVVLILAGVGFYVYQSLWGAK